MADQFRLALVRHGQTDWSLHGQHTGRTDVPLNEEGCRQARRLRAQLETAHFDAVLSSPLRRAWETAVIAGLGGRAECCPQLMEWDYGAFEGRTTKEIASERGGKFSIWDTEIPGGESLREVSRRADILLEHLRQRGGSILLISHGHFLRILAARWIEQPPEHGRRLLLDAAAVSHLGYEHDTPVICSWNQCP